MIMFIWSVEMASPDKSGSMVALYPSSEDAFYRSRTLKAHLRIELRTQKLLTKNQRGTFLMSRTQKGPVVCSYKEYKTAL